MKDLEARLRKDFTDRDYREAYASGFINTWISQQLATVRRQRGLTQGQLAELIGTKQAGISRMEREDYGRWSLSTLQRTAFALGCRLKISLETFGSLIQEAVSFSEESLERPSFENDPILTGQEPSDLVPSGGGPLGEMKRKVIPWLLGNGPKERLAEWLQGYDLPAVGDEVPPSEWLLKTIPIESEYLKYALAHYVKQAIECQWDSQPPGKRKEELAQNLLRLAAGLRLPGVLGEQIWNVYKRRSQLAYSPVTQSEYPLPNHPLIPAVTYNQIGWRYFPMWEDFVKTIPTSLENEDRIVSGMVGLAHLNPTPNISEIVRVPTSSRNWGVPVQKAIKVLQMSFERIWRDFPSQPELPMRVLDRARSSVPGWSEPVIVAWEKSLSVLPVLRTGRHQSVEHVVQFAQLSRYCRRSA